MKFELFFNEHDGQWGQKVHNFREVDDAIILMNRIATLRAERNDFYDQNKKPHFARTRIYIITRKPNCRFRQFIYSDSQNSLFYNRFTSYESWLYFLTERVNHLPNLRGETIRYIEKIRPVLNDLEFSYKDIMPDDWTLKDDVKLSNVEVIYDSIKQFENVDFNGVDDIVNNLHAMASSITNKKHTRFTFVLAFSDSTRFQFCYNYSQRDIKYGSIRILLRSYCTFLHSFYSFWGKDVIEAIDANQKVALKISQYYW